MPVFKSGVRSKSTKAANTSYAFKIAVACMVLATVGVVAKMATTLTWSFAEFQQSSQPTSNMPLQADGAFYFIEPLTTKL